MSEWFVLRQWSPQTLLNPILVSSYPSSARCSKGGANTRAGAEKPAGATQPGPNSPGPVPPPPDCPSDLQLREGSTGMGLEREVTVTGPRQSRSQGCSSWAPALLESGAIFGSWSRRCCQDLGTELTGAKKVQGIASVFSARKVLQFGTWRSPGEGAKRGEGKGEWREREEERGKEGDQRRKRWEDGEGRRRSLGSQHINGKPQTLGWVWGKGASGLGAL